MSLDVYLKKQIFRRNITHNLNVMADEAGIYQCLWGPEEIDIYSAGDLIEPLTKGLDLLKSDPDRFKKLNPSNGWGTYEGLVSFVEDYLRWCILFPECEIEVSR